MIIQEEKVEIVDEKDLKKEKAMDEELPKALSKPVTEAKGEEKEAVAEKEQVNMQDINQEKNVTDNMQKEPEELPKFQKVTEISSQKRTLLKYLAIFIGVLLLIFLLIFGGFTIYNMNNNNKIAKGIYIYGIDVSGLSKEEAVSIVSEQFIPIQSSEIKLFSKDYETSINPSEISLQFNIDSAVNYAFSIGKKGNIITDNYDVFSTLINNIQITPTFSLDEKSLNSLLNEASKNLPNAVVEASYFIEGNNLIITKGTDGYKINSDQTIKDIKSKLTDFSFLSHPVELSLTQVAPKEVDLDAIYKEVHKDPRDAYYTKNPYVVHPSENGVDFKISLDEAKKLLASSEKECKIALKTLYPKVTTNMIGSEAFPDLLAEFSTKYVASNTNRTTNLKLAAGKINGTVLLPGDTFSYNKVVGARTIAAGYKEAAIYQNGQVVDGLGGGICQISTTLFNAALFANLNIVELHNHQFVPSYVGAGRDATVVYGSKDFQFKNSRKYAIKITCSVSGGIANFKIYGVKEDVEYDVKVNATITSNTSSAIKSTTYRTLSLNGKQVSNEKIYSCTYKKH